MVLTTGPDVDIVFKTDSVRNSAETRTNLSPHTNKKKVAGHNSTDGEPRNNHVVCSHATYGTYRVVATFGLLLNVPVNSYGHVGTVSSHNRTFSWASNQYFVHILSIVIDNNA